MSETVNWLQIEADHKEIFSKFNTFLNKNGLKLENVTKEVFNRFISESNFPIFLNIPEQYHFNNYTATTTFRGINSFSQLNTKK